MEPAIHKIQSTIISPFKITDSDVRGANGEKLTFIMGKASRSDVPSQKGYRYRKGFWPKVINDEELQDRIARRVVLGMIEHPIDDADFLNTPYDKAAVCCWHAWIKNDEPWIKLAILNNEPGNCIKALLAVGHQPGCSTRAFGGYAQDNTGSYIDEEGFKCLGWDIVRNPNFEDIRMDKVSDSMENLPAFRELMQMQQLRDSVAEDYDRVHLKRDIERAVDALRAISNHL